MKKHTLTRKLVLSKKTVSNLCDQEMKQVNGGVIPTLFNTCVSEVRTCLTVEPCTCMVGGCI